MLLNVCVEKRDISCISSDNREVLLVSHKRIENCYVLNTQKSIASISSDNQQNNTSHVFATKNAVLLHSTNPINLLEKLVHDRLALLVADEASSVSDEGTDDTRGKTREEGLHTALLVDGLGAGHESLVLALRLHDGLHLQRGLRVRHRRHAHLHDIERVDAAPVRHTGDTSGHELGKSALLLHVRQRLRVNAPARSHLVLLQESTTVDLVEAEVKRHADGITDQRRAEALPAAENAVGLDDLLDGSAHAGELRLVLRIVLRADDLDLQLRLEQIHRGFDERHGNTSDGTRQEGVRETQNLAVTNGLLRLSVHDKLDGVEDHVA